MTGPGFFLTKFPGRPGPAREHHWLISIKVGHGVEIFAQMQAKKGNRADVRTKVNGQKFSRKIVHFDPSLPMLLFVPKMFSFSIIFCFVWIEK